MIEEMFRDRVTYVKADGTLTKKNIPAAVTTNGASILITDVQLPITRGDHFLRELPNRLVEDYIVENPVYNQGLGDIPATYKIAVRRSDFPPATPQSVITHITGHNARVNINSTDQSSNSVVENAPEVFSLLVTALATGIADAAERGRAVEAVKAMQDSYGTTTFKQRYVDFIAGCANHMTIISPFLPALTELLTKVG